MDCSSAFCSSPENSSPKKPFSRVDSTTLIYAISPPPEQFPVKKPRVEGCNCEKLPAEDLGGCNCGKLPKDKLGDVDDDDVSDYEDREVDEDTLREYMKQVEESEGYDVDDFLGFYIWGMITPFTGFEEFPAWCNNVKQSSIASIEYFNEKNDSCYEFLEVEKLNIKSTGVFRFFITFKAKNCADPDYPEVTPKTFQATVDFGAGGAVVESCRVKQFP